MGVKQGVGWGVDSSVGDVVDIFSQIIFCIDDEYNLSSYDDIFRLFEWWKNVGSLIDESLE